MIRNMSTFMATALAIMAFALTTHTAAAQSYTGNFPLILSQSRPAGGNAVYCLALTDNGSLGRTHSGPAELAGVDPGGPVFGTFQVIGKLITVTIQQPSDTGQNAGLVFVAPAADGKIGMGVFFVVFGGEEVSSSLAQVGTKGGCSP